MRGVGYERTIALIRAGRGGVRIIEKYLTERVTRKEEQDTQSDWVRADKPAYCPLYAQIKKEFERDKCWDTGVSGKRKEQWARVRCENIGEERKKGYINRDCGVCGIEEESLEHICQCKEARKEIKDWVEGADK